MKILNVIYKKQSTEDIKFIYLFGFAVYKRIGEFEVIDLFGLKVYKRVGSLKQLLGFTYGY